MSGNMNDDEFNSNLDLPRRQQELFVAALNSDSPKSHGNRLAQLSNPHANPDEEDSESDIEDSDESAIEDDDESQWEDSEDENGPSGDNDKVSFQRVDSKPNLTSRRSLLTTLMHEGDRAQALQNAASRSTPALRRSRAASPKRPSVTASSSTHAEIPRSKPIIMTTSKTHTPPALSPRSTRRNMLTTELTESLRKHLLWERQQKNSTNAVLKRRHSSTDATMRNSIAEKSQQSTDAVKADKSFEFATYKYPGEFDNPELMLTLRSRVMLDKTPHNNQAILNQRAKAPPKYNQSGRIPARYAYDFDHQNRPGGYPSNRRRHGDLPERATVFLKEWLQEHAESPYPTDEEMNALAASTGLLSAQISRWFINARRRNPGKGERELARKINNHNASEQQQAQRTNGIEKHDTDEIQEDSITISKEVSQKSHIVGQVYTSDDASRIDHKTSLPPSFPANTSFAGTRAVHVDMKRKILDWMQEYLKEEANGEDADVERGPVEFSHAISYLSKIKNLSSTQPGIFKQFLEILQAYQRGSMPIKDVHAQMTQLLDSAPDLLEEFEQFIPETAAQQPHGHFDFSSTKTANLLGPRAYGGVGYTETREPVFEHDMRSLTPDSVSDKGFSHIVETDDSSNEVKKYIVESLMQKVYDLLGYGPSGVSESSSSQESSSDEDIKESIHWPAPSSGEGSTEAEPHSSPADAGTSSQVQHRGKKTNTETRNSESCRSFAAPKLSGKRKQSTGDEPDGEDGEQGNSGRGNPRPLKSSRHGPRFACPFYKKRREIHGSNASCLWPGFNTISRLKEHLYRVHLSNVEGNNICPRCRETFESGLSLVRHLARTERCVQVVVPEQEDGLEEDQVIRLRNRDRGTEPEDKWRHIYRICHRLPEDAETPWPYCDQESPADQAVEGYDWYQRQHLPNLIREQLEREPAIGRFVEVFGDRLPAIIRECQMNLHRRFTSSRAAMNPANEHGLAPTVQPQTENAMEPDLRPVPPPVAFEAPPNTDNGMTSSEAQQVHAMSSQKDNRNSDSGYGSGVFEPHQPVELCDHEHRESQSDPSGDAPQTMHFPHHSYPPPNPEDRQSASTDKPLGEQDAHRSNREASAHQTNSVQMPSFTQPAFSLDHGQPFMTHVDNLGNNSTEEPWWDSIDLSLFDEIGPSVLPSMHNPFQNRISDEGGMEDLYDFEP